MKQLTPQQLERKREICRNWYRRHHPDYGKRRPYFSSITKEFILSSVIKDPVTGCWNWTKAKVKGYGKIRGRFNGGPKKNASAHRAAWELWVGPIETGLWVLHKCDNPSCCNPDHLFLGTVIENSADRARKGRTVVPNKKLTFEQAQAIRSDARCARLIALDYGISPTGIWKIKRGEIYTKP